MRIINAGHRFIVDSRDHEFMQAYDSFVFDYSRQYFVSTDRSQIEKLQKDIDSKVYDRFCERREKIHQDKIRASASQTSSLDVRLPEGLSLRPYQVAGVDYTMDRPNALIGDEMGLGKTVQAIASANMMDNIKHVLIICPSSLKYNWRKEWEKWSIHKIDPVILSYNNLSKWRDSIRIHEWDVIIADECHYMKNLSAGRTREVVGSQLIKPLKAKKHIWLSGTPILNNPSEMWVPCHFLAPHDFKNRFIFDTRYSDISNELTLQRFNRDVRASFMIRRMKDDVLTDLPPKTRQVIEYDAEPSTEVQVLQDYHREFEGFNKLIDEAESLRGTKEFTKRLQELEACMETPHFRKLATSRKRAGLNKVPSMCSHIGDSLDNSGKVVVFAYHQEVIDRIAEKFGDKCVVITGKTPVNKRGPLVERFQNDDNCSLFLGNILAAGEGLTLTAASHLIILEPDWVPARLMQAEDRIHRLTQTEPVLIQYFVARGSVDARVTSKIVEKLNVISGAIDLPVKIEL